MPRDYRRTFDRNFRKYFHLCKHCNVGFSSARPDSEYHAPKCREAARRKRMVEAERQAAIAAAKKAAITKKVGKSKRHKKAEAKKKKRVA